MASSNKTDKLQLPQWQLSDKPEMEDFNDAFEKVEDFKDEFDSHLAETVPYARLPVGTGSSQVSRGNHTHNNLIHSSSGNTFIVAGDSGGNYCQSLSIYTRTYTSTSQMVRVTNQGTLGRSTSSRKYKLLEEPVKTNAYKLLEVQPKNWYDKRACEELAHTLSTGEETEGLKVTRISGLIAEDIEDAGLKEYVIYNEEGEVDGYDPVIWTLLIPIVKDHEEKIETLENKVETLESEVHELKQQVQLLLSKI